MGSKKRIQLDQNNLATFCPMALASSSDLPLFMAARFAEWYAELFLDTLFLVSIAELDAPATVAPSAADPEATSVFLGRLEEVSTLPLAFPLETLGFDDGGLPRFFLSPVFGSDSPEMDFLALFLAGSAPSAGFAFALAFDFGKSLRCSLGVTGVRDSSTGGLGSRGLSLIPLLSSVFSVVSKGCGRGTGGKVSSASGSEVGSPPNMGIVSSSSIPWEQGRLGKHWETFMSGKFILGKHASPRLFLLSTCRMQAKKYTSIQN